MVDIDGARFDWSYMGDDEVPTNMALMGFSDSEFCGIERIKREFNNARTAQQNKVAERKNRTLIEAAKTMVLVTKPHNKTPYELLIGRAPIISFVRPFGCPVTILNTLDYLGKFDGKANEGFLVGYSINSKDFRVYNSRTKKVEENLHVNFLENKPNVAGSSPEWLFDIDSLTNLMNYQPMPNLEDTGMFDDAYDDRDEGAEANYNKLETVIPGHRQEKGIDYDEVFAPVARIKAIKLFLAYASIMDFTVYQIDVKSTFLYGTIEEEDEQRKDGIFLSQDKYVCDILKKFGFSSVKSASTPMETHKPLSKDSDGTDVDVYLYRSMIGLLMYLTSSKPDIMFPVNDYAGASLDRKFTTRGCQFLADYTFWIFGIECKSGLVMKIGIELKGYLLNDGSADLFWSTASSKTVNFVKQIHAIVAGKVVVISESLVRSDLLNDDEDGITCLTNDEIFENLALMGYEPFSTKLTFQKDEAVNQEEGDKVERAITTDASLEDAHDSGRPRRQETIGGTSAQTRSERVIEQPNEPPLTEGYTSRSGEGRLEENIKLTDTVPTPHDSPLTGGYTPGSNEGRITLVELIETCTILLNRVTQLQTKLSTTKAVYNKAFITLTNKVKKLESQLKQKRSRVVIHSSDEEGPSVHIEDSPKQERIIKEIDKDENINLRSSTKDKGKGILQETYLLKKLKKKEMIQLSLDEELAQTLYADELAKEEDQVYTFVPKDFEIEREVMKRAKFNLHQRSSKKQRLDQQIEETEEEARAQGDSDQEVEELKLYMRIIPEEDIAIEAIPLVVKPLVIIEYKIVKEGKVNTYHITRADGCTRRYTSMINLLKSIDIEDLEPFGCL
nr:hypothetical protein [Tanacetum cinerariifolium]